MDNKKLRLDEKTLTFLLEYILEAIKEDRKLALNNHEALVGMITGMDGQGMGSMEVQVFLQSLSSAMNGFLGNAGKSTDNAIKIAKLVSEHIIKSDEDSGLSDADREELAELAQAETRFAHEREIITDSIIDTEGFSSGN